MTPGRGGPAALGHRGVQWHPARTAGSPARRAASPALSRPSRRPAPARSLQLGVWTVLRVAWTCPLRVQTEADLADQGVRPLGDQPIQQLAPRLREPEVAPLGPPRRCLQHRRPRRRRVPGRSPASAGWPPRRAPRCPARGQPRPGSPETMTTGICAVSGVHLRRRSTSAPDRTGNPRSSRIRSGRADASRSAVAPSAATVGVCPALRRKYATIPATASSSSTIKIRAMPHLRVLTPLSYVRPGRPSARCWP